MYFEFQQMIVKIIFKSLNVCKLYMILKCFKLAYSVLKFYVFKLFILILSTCSCLFLLTWFFLYSDHALSRVKTTQVYKTQFYKTTMRIYWDPTVQVYIVQVYKLYWHYLTSNEIIKVRDIARYIIGTHLIFKTLIKKQHYQSIKTQHLQSF